MRQRVKDIIAEVTTGLQETPELVHLGDPVLRQKTTNVDVGEGKTIGEQLIKILIKYRNISGVGAGLAAPQIGLSKRVFVTISKEGNQIFINPRIINSGEKHNFYRESCLSSRMMWNDTERPEEIEMVWTDESGAEKRATFNGFRARLIQHEYDHLEGVCCIDKAIPGTIEYSGAVKEEKLREKAINQE